MKTVHALSLSILLCNLTPAARAEEPAAAVVMTIERDLLAPLAKKDRQRSKFSRSEPPPDERRVRIPDPAPAKDARGEEFVAFTVDVRFGEDEWSRDEFSGCVYPRGGAIYVKFGEAYRAAAFLLGKEAPYAPEGVCKKPAAIAVN
jgi:hypothetical protein